MYCSRATTIGTEIMGKNVTAGAAPWGAAPFKLEVYADGSAMMTLLSNLTEYEYSSWICKP